MFGSILIGNQAELTATFTNRATGAPENPAAVRIRLSPPDGGPVVELTPASVGGLATAQFTPTVAGRWWARVETDTPDSAAEGILEVTASRVPAPN